MYGAPAKVKFENLVLHLGNSSFSHNFLQKIHHIKLKNKLKNILCQKYVYLFDLQKTAYFVGSFNNEVLEISSI